MNSSLSNHDASFDDETMRMMGVVFDRAAMHSEISVKA